MTSRWNRRVRCDAETRGGIARRKRHAESRRRRNRFAEGPPAASPSKKDPCGDTKSKWAHMQCQEYNASAPGDEYFGRMKISYLGIDNTFKDGAISAGAYTTDPNLIEKLHVCRRSAYALGLKVSERPATGAFVLLGHSGLPQSLHATRSEKAWHYIQILVTKYPNTYFGKNMKAALASGFTEHWFGLAQICPTPSAEGREAGEDAERHADAVARARAARYRHHHSAVRPALTDSIAGVERVPAKHEEAIEKGLRRSGALSFWFEAMTRT